MSMAPRTHCYRLRIHQTTPNNVRINPETFRNIWCLDLSLRLPRDRRLFIPCILMMDLCSTGCNVGAGGLTANRCDSCEFSFESLAIFNFRRWFVKLAATDTSERTCTPWRYWEHWETCVVRSMGRANWHGSIHGTCAMRANYLVSEHNCLRKPVDGRQSPDGYWSLTTSGTFVIRTGCWVMLKIDTNWN